LIEWGSVTDEQQADWTARGIEWMSDNWDWFGVSSIWYFRQVGFIPPDSPEYYFAMVDLEFTPRQVYLAVRDEAVERRTALPGIYGPMESPLQQTGQWRRVSDPTATFGDSLLSDRWGSEMRIEFAGTDLTLIPGDLDNLSGWMYVTLNGEPAQEHLFSVDSLGRTYLDLDQLPDSTSEIPVVERFGTSRPQQTNVFVLHIHEDASLSLASIEVDFDRSYQRFTLILGASMLGIIASVAMIRRRLRM
jgi:hypothetical protein